MDNPSFEPTSQNEKSTKSDSTSLGIVLKVDNFSSTTVLADPYTQNVGSINTVNEKDELYNPFEERHPEHPNSDFGAITHLLKGSLGSGILAMPFAYKNAGLAAGAFGTLIVGLICTHCVNILVQCSQILCKRTRTPQLGFAETAEEAFKTGPRGLKPFSKFAAGFVNFALCLTYLSGLSVYIVIVAESLSEVTKAHGINTISVQGWMCLELLVLIPITQIRPLKFLVPISAVANVSIIGALLITFYYTFTDLPPIDSIPMIKSVTSWPVFFSTVIFAMEGIGVMLPIEHTMKKPQHFLGCPGVLNIAMTIIVSLYAMVGFFGYWRYSDTVSGNVILNIPPDEILGQTGKILLSISILLTYSLQYYVPMKIIWTSLRSHVGQKWVQATQISMRVFFVLATLVVSLSIPNLEALINLVGAICFSILGLMLPAIIETVTIWNEDLGWMLWKLWKNIFLFLFATMTLVSGSASAIEQIINPEPSGNVTNST